MKRTRATLLAFSIAATSTQAASTLLLDFGRHDGVQGNPTVSPDTNGNYWNNLSPAGGPFQIESGVSFTGLVDIANMPTSVGVSTTSVWRSNGRNNGGLLSPNPALLGDFAIGTATEDYWFTEIGGTPALGNVSTLVITGLDPTMTYDFRMFATRVTDDAGIRETNYAFTGSNGTFQTNVQTSGGNIGANGTYDGNDDLIVGVSGVSPTAGGEINLTLTAVQGNFGYLGIMEITAVPEPSAAALLLLGALPLLRRRRI